MNAPRFLLADDHPVIRAGVRGLLRDRFPGAVFVEAATAREALAAAREPAVIHGILLDINLPGRSGLEILGELREAQPRAPVLVLSMHSEEQFATRALRAGAAGYLTKDQAPEELARAVEKVLAGGHYVSAALAEHLAATLHARAPEAAHEALSAREFEVLRMLARGRNGKEIAALLSLSFKTVSTYRARVLQKLRLHSNAELAQYALRHGLLEE